jgi:predicted sulfurtransferase
LTDILIFSTGVTGRLRVSREGFNGTLTGPYDGIRGFTRDMRNYPGGYFEEMKDGDDFKYTDNLPVGQVSLPPICSRAFIINFPS